MIFIYFYQYLANFLIGFFIYFHQYLENYIINLFSYFTLKNFLKLFFIVPIYVFIQRIHNQTQQRSLKAVSDELVKINDFVIEFSMKLSLLKEGEIIDDKILSELIILKSKINSHIIYMNEYINGFPYGGPINYLCLFVFKRYLFNQPKQKTSNLEFKYQEIILNDTYLSLEKNFRDDNKLKYIQITTAPLNQKKIDQLISVSRELLEHLETNTR